MKPVRLGVLGAARIAPFSLYSHVPKVPDLELVAVAEEYQSEQMLAEYAKKHHIPKTYRSFKELLANPDINAVYVPLPISFHSQWVLEAIKAGKHVLCEKPLAANAQEAQIIHDAAQGTGLVVAEAMHFQYHPLAGHVRDILASGEIGDVISAKASFSAYLPFDNFRMHYNTGGGVTIDMGCYPLAFLRTALGTEPHVIQAKAGRVADKNVDGWMDADLEFPPGPANKSNQPTRAHVFSGMRKLSRPLSVSMSFKGTAGSLSLINFIKPEVYHHVIIRGKKGFRFVRVPGGSTYGTQLAAFVEAIKTGKPIRTNTQEAVHNMQLIDAIYTAAGMPVRGLKL